MLRLHQQFDFFTMCHAASSCEVTFNMYLVVLMFHWLVHLIL